MMAGRILFESFSMANKDLRTLLILRSITFISGFVILKNWFALLSTAKVTSYLDVSILLQIMETFLSSPPHSREGTAINNLILLEGFTNSFLFDFLTGQTL